MHHSAKQDNIWSRFLNWATMQEKNRFMWLAIAITAHGCIITPLTILSVMLSGNNNMFYWSLCLGAMAMSLVSNLAAMPTKWTIPVFFLSILIDLGILVSLVAGALG